MMKLIRTLFKPYIINKSNSNESDITNQYPEISGTLSGNLPKDIQTLKTLFDRSFDIVFREFQIGGSQKATLIFLEEFVDEELINSAVLKPLFEHQKDLADYMNSQLNEIKSFITSKVISSPQISQGFKLQEIVDYILLGYTVLLIDEVTYAILINLKKKEDRSIEEPVIEPSIRGPHDGFTESLRTNVSLVRRRLKTSKLKVEKIQVGQLSKTDIVITYIDGIVDNSLVEEVKKRIFRIEADGILESGYIEEFIEDNPFSIFPQFGYTERPDRFTSTLLEGHVGIIVDNTPIALIAPQTFFQLMQSVEDYYERYIPTSLLRLLRYLFLGVALTLPSFYIAILTFHQGMIPVTLLRTIAASREGVPFPLVVESLLMEIFFEGLREAGVRLPRAIGQTVSIVGALIIGESAVRAGIVSPATVVIVSITGIASFIIPRYNLSLSIRTLRLVMMILAALFGLYGMFIGFLIVLIHMVNLRSFGVPYLSPVAPLDLNSLKDIFIRAPWWAMIKRPGFIESKDSQRMKKALRPRPPKRN